MTNLYYNIFFYSGLITNRQIYVSYISDKGVMFVPYVDTLKK